MLHKGPQIWLDNLEQPMQQRTDMRFGMKETGGRVWTEFI
jgi:hypothetical protein